MQSNLGTITDVNLVSSVGHWWMKVCRKYRCKHQRKIQSFLWKRTFPLLLCNTFQYRNKYILLWRAIALWHTHSKCEMSQIQSLASSNWVRKDSWSPGETLLLMQTILNQCFDLVKDIFSYVPGKWGILLKCSLKEKVRDWERCAMDQHHLPNYKCMGSTAWLGQMVLLFQQLEWQES